MSSFYDRREWKELRFKVLQKYGWKCMGCNATRDDGVRIDVDHIKPKSIYPELALTESNLQVLCGPCNEGKSNKWTTDFRSLGFIGHRVLQVKRRTKEARRAAAAHRLSAWIMRKVAAGDERPEFRSAISRIQKEMRGPT